MKTAIEGCYVANATKHDDHRGSFLEVYNIDKLPSYFPKNFPQTNVSVSEQWAVRGLHIAPFAKFVTCIKGRVFDVVVDMRKDSPTFMQHFSIVLSEAYTEQVLVPPYCAHGFMALGDSPNIVVYSQTSTYNPSVERSVRWDDPDLGIVWPQNSSGQYLISQKDIEAPLYEDALRNMGDI